MEENHSEVTVPLTDFLEVQITMQNVGQLKEEAPEDVIPFDLVDLEAELSLLLCATVTSLRRYRIPDGQGSQCGSNLRAAISAIK
ncbi:hypothetical protein Tco_0033331 [Tanacetum coccineum]